MITLTTLGQQWDDQTAPWEPATQVFDKPGYWNAMDALHAISGADHYENTRVASWSATTEAERAEVRDMVGKRPHLRYVLALEV